MRWVTFAGSTITYGILSVIVYILPTTQLNLAAFPVCSVVTASELETETWVFSRVLMSLKQCFFGRNLQFSDRTVFALALINLQQRCNGILASLYEAFVIISFFSTI